MTDAPRIATGPAPARDARAAVLAAFGLRDSLDCPSGFAGHSAVRLPDRDLPAGQGAATAPVRARLVPRGMGARACVVPIGRRAVRPDDREAGLEECIAGAPLPLRALSPVEGVPR